MSKDNTIVGSVNPLIFLAADDRFKFAGQSLSQLSPESVLQYICSETFIPEMDNIRKSYTTIAEKAIRLFIVPAEYKILEKIVRPLKNAIGSYMLGNYLQTIALCGMVSEMSAIFLFEISNIVLNDKPSNKLIQSLFDRDFEKLGQDQRIRILSTFGLIDNETKENFDSVRIIRKQYLHLLSKEHSNMASDAKKAFDSTFEVVISVLGLHVNNGKVILSQNVIDYLNAKGFTEKPESDKPNHVSNS